MEKQLYFMSGNQRLFGFLHVPDKNNNEIGIVIANAFAEESSWSQRVMVSFARKLSQSGYSMLRFDYSGTGDSQGEFENFDLETYTQDIHAAIKCIRNEVSLKHTGLLGLRLGATLGSLVNENSAIADFLILMQPIDDVKGYMQGCIRANLASQMTNYGKIKQNRVDIIEMLERGGYLNYEGYNISGRLYKQANSIQSPLVFNNYQKPILVVKNTGNTFALSIQNKLSYLTETDEVEFWREGKLYHREANKYYAIIIEWLQEIALRLDE
jgi:alpha/beta superfamily hydrolase